MSRFNNYIDTVDTLEEKVTQKEIKVALKNDNILIGCEFEMWIPDVSLSSSPSSDIDYDDARKSYNQYIYDVEVYQNEYNAYAKETDEIKSDLDALKDSFESAEPYIYGDDYDFNDDWIGEGHGKTWVDNFNDDMLYKKVRGLKGKKISMPDVDTPEKLESLLSDISDDITVIEDDIEYREDSGIYEEIEPPDLLSGEYYAYIKYMSYMNEIGVGVDIEAKVKKGYYHPGESIPPSPPDYMSDDDDEIDDTFVYDNLNHDDAPFANNWEAGSYGSVTQTYSNGIWAIEDDPSLGGSGVGVGIEIKSPPTKLPEAMDDIKDMLDWMKDNGYKTNATVGFHVHMSLLKPSKDFDPLKLLLFTEQGFIFHLFPDRVDNAYVTDVHKKFKSSGTLKASDRKKIFDEKKIMLNLFTSPEHYDAINIKDVSDNHVEFRYMGADYRGKYKEIEAIIGGYAHNMALAADPEYMKKEYHHKLSRVFNKMELFSVSHKLYRLQTDICKLKSHGDDFNHYVDIMETLAKKYQKTKDALKRNYKISVKDLTEINKNRNYIKSIDDELINDMSKAFNKKGIKTSQQKYINDKIRVGSCNKTFKKI